MRAEVMLDSISEVTETEDKYRGLPTGARAVQIADGKTTNYFLTTFGRSRREPNTQVRGSARTPLERRDVLGRLIHEYRWRRRRDPGC